MTPRIVAVIGAGAMGTGIAQVVAASGLTVHLFDTTMDALLKAGQRIKDSLERQSKKGVLAPDEAAKIPHRIVPFTDLTDAKDADLVIEAVYENEDAKQKIWKRLDEMCRLDALFASNTSSISITQLAAVVRRPERFIGMHFFNPVPVMKLIEVIRGNRTDDATCEAIVNLSRFLGKTPVEVNDYPGFVSNRVLMPLINEAIFTVHEGVAKAEAVDEIFKLGMAHPMGPLTLADFIGLDVCLNIMEVLQRGFGDPKYRPCPLLKQMVAAGKLGRKSGQGFFRYEQ